MDIGLSAQTNQPVLIHTAAQQTAAPALPQALPPGCATDALHHIQMQNPLYAQQQQQMDNRIYNATQQGVERGVVRIIPIVVHIIHNNGPENISDAQVITGINDLNMFFANNFGSTSGANSNIQFCLAKQDPDGNFTTGITRTVSTLTNMVSETNDLELKNLVRWDPTHYLNIWLVKEITSLSMGSGIAGYAYFPSAHGSPVDGIVNEAGFFGGHQLGQYSNTYDNSKVHVHEVGHYLGLYHTFEGGCTNSNCQLDGDRVCDTPPDNSTAAVSCFQFTANTCNTDEDDLSANNPYRPIANGGLGDQDDMIGNFMDYGYQVCQSFFTQEQCDRMNAALTTSRASLLQSIACQDICANPVNVAFTASDTTILIGGQIVFTINVPNATYTWYVNGVASGTGTTFTYQHSPTGTVGNYEIKVVGSNGAIECENACSLVVSVECPAQADYTVISSSPYIVGSTFSALNTSTGATGYTWVLDGVVQNNNTNFSQQFTAPGGHNVFLVASAGNCADTSATCFFTVGNCNISGMNQHWVFNNISLNFNNGNGQPSVGFSPLNIGGQESTTTISDPNGNLLFYSDGINVYNRNNLIMPNGSGLLGNPSTTQSCLATPFPGNPNLYYLFTADAVENNLQNGIRYNIIDMTLNNGLGDIVSGQKNVLLRDDVGEMLTGTFHTNGRDIWVVMANRSTNAFYTYLITDQGISANPVVSTQLGQNTTSGLGPMKFSADGNMIAATMLGGWPWSILLANFNRTTGQLTNGRDIWLSTVVNNQPHCFEFSPDNSKLYVNLWQPGEVWQYNLAAGNITAIAASKAVVTPFPTGITYGQMARGNDGKIYFSSFYTGYMDYIANPNAAWPACNFTLGTINAYINGTYSMSIPNMIQGLEQPYIPSIAGKTNLCTGENATYNVPYLTNGQTVAWTYTGNGTITVNPNHTATLTNHSGSGQLIAVVTGDCGITRDTVQIQNVPAQQVSLGNDTSICGGELMLFANPTNLSSYLWNTGSTGTGIYITQPGTYWVKTTDSNGCTDHDTIVVTSGGSLAVNLGPDVTSCNGTEVTLNAGPGFTDYTWQDGSSGATYTTTSPGTYWVSVSNGCAIGRDTVVVSGSNISFELMYNNDTIACKNELPFSLTAPAGYQQYLWQNGSSSQTINVGSVGAYWVGVTDANGCTGIDTFRVVDCTGIDELALQNIKVYPNPASNILTIGNLLPNNSYYMALYNTAGQLVAQPACIKKAEVVVDINALAPGLYFYRIVSQNGASVTGRFVKD